MSGSILDRDAGYPDWDFRGFSQNLQAHASTVPVISRQINYSLFILTFDAIQSEKMTRRKIYDNHILQNVGTKHKTDI
jgi:hypothetical protein